MLKRDNQHMNLAWLLVVDLDDRLFPTPFVLQRISNICLNLDGFTCDLVYRYIQI
jgi:hypothetical protein